MEQQLDKGDDHTFQISITFRGSKFEMTVSSSGELTALDLKEKVLIEAGQAQNFIPEDIKLIHAGKILSDQSTDIFDLLSSKSSLRRPKKHVFLATLSSTSEQQKTDQEIRRGMESRLVRDDLSKEGQKEMQRRKQLGARMLAKAAYKEEFSRERSPYVFGRIETLPNLPMEDKAREILTELSRDRGVLACMAKHQFTVGCLAELAPDGKVGQDPVCIMGLNQNKGQKILLRLRTDDFKGFRKILSIRKVLYHELAHNVHADHDENFYQLMRQIEKECTDANIPGNSKGHILVEGERYSMEDENNVNDQPFIGRTSRLGGLETTSGGGTLRSAGEMAAQAAIARMGVSRDCDENNKNNSQLCSCGLNHNDMFLPNNRRQRSSERNENSGDSCVTKRDLD